MAKPRTLELRFPSMGVVRRQPHERQYSAVSYPTPYSYNVRLADPLTNRLRGGSFTGRSAESRPSSIVYRDRTLSFSGNAITASRVGDSTDTTLSSDVSDMLRPALFQFSEADETGEDIVALVPHKDQYLVGFTATETWVLQGDPLSGTRRRVSDEVGIIGADAWCVAHDTVYFLSSRGLYAMSVDGSGLKALSEDAVPDELIGLTDAAASLDYYHADRGVYIHLTDSPSWFFDTERGGFWPFDTSTTDSHVLIGPLRLGGPDSYGMVQRLHGIMASDSADVTWRLVIGDTAEEACANGKTAITAAVASSSYWKYFNAEGIWSAGRSSTSWPRTRGMWCCLWLQSAGAWAYEAVHMTVAPFGRWRG
jgi:hypothetical protein